MKKTPKSKATPKAKKTIKASVLRDLTSRKNPKGGKMIKSDGQSCGPQTECC